MNWKEQAEIEEKLKTYVKALVKLEIEKRAKEQQTRKTSCKIQDLLKFMNNYEAASKGNLNKKK